MKHYYNKIVCEGMVQGTTFIHFVFFAWTKDSQGTVLINFCNHVFLFPHKHDMEEQLIGGPACRKCGWTP